MKIEEKTFKLRSGRRVRYVVSGEGKKTYVFLHGLLGVPEMARQLVPELAPSGWKIVGPYLPGSDEGWGNLRNLTYKEICDELAEWVRAVGKGKVVLHGNSFGGGMAVGVARRIGMRTGKIILTGGLVFPLRRREALGKAVWLACDAVGDWIAAIGKEERSREGWLGKRRRYRPKVGELLEVVRLLRTVEKPKGRAARLPVLVFSGSQDRVIKGMEVLRALESFPQKRVVEFSGGHFWFKRQYPEYFKELRAFVEDVN